MRLLYRAGPMESLRKWFYKPKRDDRSLLAQFFFADDALNMIAAELDSFDGRKDPERCSTLVNQLRHAQDRVLNITSQIMDQVLGDERVARGFRVKFPEDVLQDNLAGQLWFGAECLAAGSSIMNREEESIAMRPLAKALTRSLETVRSLLREQCLRPRGMALSQHDDMLHESLRIFDRLFAEFELCYVSAMVKVKSPHEFEAQQLICVLFSESLRRALKRRLLTQEQVDSYDPALMFAVPRLAIVSGLLIYSSGPLSIDKTPQEMSDMFRPFRTLLHKIRSLLWTLDKRELLALERLLCTNEDVSNLSGLDLPPESEIIDDQTNQYPDIGEFVSRFYADHAPCKDLYTQSSNEPVITESDYLPDNIEVMTPILDGLRRLSTDDVEPSDSEYETLERNRRKTPEIHGRTPDIIRETPEFARNHSTDTNSTDTFQYNDNKEYLDVKSRKTSRTETNDLSALRNLSTNGLMMFDPLVINAAASTSNENRQLPDHDLVTSLNEQVTEIADRLSSIVTNDVDLIDHNHHSFSADDVPTLLVKDCDSEAFGYSGPRNEQLSCLPSTSHGYLIPNAISHEPVVLSLSQNNSAIFSQEEDNTDVNSAILNNDLPLVISDNMDCQIANTNISIANANLSSLLLTNEEFRHNFIDSNETDDNDDTSFHSAKMNIDKDNDDEKVKFVLGCDSDHESPVDSGVSTENTSLDRSPDTDQRKEIKDEHFMKQNRVLKSPSEDKDNVKEDRNSLESSFSNKIDDSNDVTVNLQYAEDDTQKSEAGSSHFVSAVNISRLTESEATNLNSERASDRNSERNSESRKALQDWGVNVPSDEEFKTIDNVIEELRRKREADKNIRSLVDEDNNNSSNLSANVNSEVGPSSSSKSRKSRKSSTNSVSKSKRKTNKMWSPGIVILDNRSSQNQSSPVKLDLDHLVDESGTNSCEISECLDDEQIALALQAQELAARQQARGKFKSSEDLIHRLFVCIAGVADQLQTNFAADLRNILKSVFLMNQTPDAPEPNEDTNKPVSEKQPTIEYEASEDQVIQNGSSLDSVYSGEEVYADSTDSAASDNPRLRRPSSKSNENGTNLQASVSTGDLTYTASERRSSPASHVEAAPEWVPDIAAPACMRCCSHFTAFRRRHHCRNCGKVFCASCSSNSIPLPRYGQMKPVRVCDECFRDIAVDCIRAQTSNR